MLTELEQRQLDAIQKVYYNQNEKEPLFLHYNKEDTEELIGYFEYIFRKKKYYNGVLG